MEDKNNNKKGNALNPIAHKEVDYLDPSGAAKKEARSVKEKVDDAKFKFKVIKAIGKAILSIIKAIASIPYVGPIIIIAIIIAIIAIGVQTALEYMPGMMTAQIKEFWQGVVDAAQDAFYATGADAVTNDEDIVNAAKYIESMGYDLVGYGFVTPNLDIAENIKTFDDYTADTEHYTYQLDKGDSTYKFYELP